MTITMERLLVVAVLVGMGSALDNGLALTPPMGWLAWERYRCETDCKTFPDSCINDKLFMAMADKVVELGLKDLGYEYINIDDCWLAKERDPDTGRLLPDPDRFPNGIKALADYVHAKGLKLGIYEDFGFETCAHYPGSEYYMQLDAQTFAEWEVDMLKFDGCNSDAADMHIGYPIMGRALNKTGRPILYSCEWPLYEWVHKVKSNYSAIRETCNMWRTFTDVTDYWQSILTIVDYYGDDKNNVSAFTGPGGWADPDMLVTGDYGLSYTQQKAQMGMWAMFAAPLFMSNDLRAIDDKPLQLLKNTHVIAINQDPLGIQAQRLFEIPGAISVWMKPLVKGNIALAYFNKFYEGRPTPLTLKLQDLGLKNSGGYNVTEVFDQRPMGVYKPSDDFSVLVDPTGILLVKIEPLGMK